MDSLVQSYRNRATENYVDTYINAVNYIFRKTITSLTDGNLLLKIDCVRNDAHEPLQSNYMYECVAPLLNKKERLCVPSGTTGGS